jgi:5-methylcytosine-specific restriction endonuclease McrA
MGKSPKRPSKKRRAFIARWIIQYGPLCPMCREPMTLERAPRGTPHDPRMATVDHHVPRSAGGTNRHHNLRVLCAACNMAKADQNPLPPEVTE